MDCGCNNLGDSAGVESLKALYAKQGAGGLTFMEKMSNNLSVLGVGAGLGLLGFFVYGKTNKGRR
jgi:hypothetical protein